MSTRLIVLLSLLGLIIGVFILFQREEPLKVLSNDVYDQEILLVKEALPQTAPAQPNQKRHLLIFNRAESYVHQSIPLGTRTFELLGEKTGAYETEISEDYTVFSPQNLDRFDAILFLNTTQLLLNEGQQSALLAFVRGGKGIIGIHAASDNFHQWKAGQQMIGAVFDGHPWPADSIVKIKLDESEHPINAPFNQKSFYLQEEIYQFQAPYSRKELRILLSLDLDDPTTSRIKTMNPASIRRPDNDFAISWIKPEGDGRVFYSSLGHNKHIYWTPQILGHFLAGIQYALGDYKVPDEPLSNTFLSYLKNDD